MSWNNRKTLLKMILTISLLLPISITSKAEAYSMSQTFSKIDLNAPVSFKYSNNKVYGYQADNISIRKVLRDLANMGNVNILLDESVTGNISISFNNITVRDAFDYLRNLLGLSYTNKGDNIILVSTQENATEKGINRTISKIIPVKYINAKLVTQLLNLTVFASSSSASGGSPSSSSSSEKATPEFRTNSVIIVGDSNDIRLAEDMIERIDIPREVKTFRVNHSGVVTIAQMLQASIFNDGMSPYNASTASGVNGGVNAMPSTIQVDVETIEEGSGSASEVSASSGGEGITDTQQTFTLRQTKMETKEIKISPEGPIIVPDTRTSTLTIMGTPEQIALAESVIPTLDQKLPQVAIETSLVEIIDDAYKTLDSQIGGSDGQFSLGFNNQVGSPVNIAPNNIIGLPTLSGGIPSSAFAWTTSPVRRSSQFVAQLSSLISSNKAKILANPTVIASHNTESVISITEEIVRKTTVTVDGVSGLLQVDAEIGEAGIVLNILPKISNDGYINLRIRPSVSSVRDRAEVGTGFATLLNKRDLSVQEVRVANNQTLALGGLVTENEVKRRFRVPILGDIPLLGPLFSSSERSEGSRRYELLMLVTPKILEDSTPTPYQISSTDNAKNVYR